MSAPNPNPRLRPWRLQYSLRFVFLTFTLFAIAFPIWYRWPYEEVVEQKTPAGAVASRRTSTWQRQWGEDRLLHGPMTTWAQGDFLIEMMYVDGLPHGPYRQSFKGQPQVSGQYVRGKKEGSWTHVMPGSSFEHGSTHQVRWHEGRLDGPYTGKSHNGKPFQFDFAKGRLKEFNGQPVQTRLLDLMESGALDVVIIPGSRGESVAEAMRQDTSFEFVEQPLRDVVSYLHEVIQTPIVLDTARISAPDRPITVNYHGLDFCSALTLLTVSHDLDCDFRYGMLWITTAEDAKDWHDPTGVAEIKPDKGTALARAWNESASLEVANQPLAPVLNWLARPLAIEIDTSQLPQAPDYPTAPPRPTLAPQRPTPPGSSPAPRSAPNPNDLPVTAYLKGLPFRHLLGFLLNRTHCRCQLEGDKLVILPPGS